MTDKAQILKMFAEQKRNDLIGKVKQLALDMASTAKQLDASADQGDLSRLVWLVRSYDPVLAAQLEAAHESLHFLNGLERA